MLILYNTMEDLRSFKPDQVTQVVIIENLNKLFS